MLNFEFSSFVRRDLWDPWLIINNMAPGVHPMILQNNNLIKIIH